MKREMKRKLAYLLASVMTVSLLGGCGSDSGGSSEVSGNVETEVSQQESSTESTATEDSASEEVQDTEKEYVDIEVWYENTGNLPIEKDGMRYNWYKEKIGVGITEPYVEWNGGTTYQEQLNFAISSDEMPDMFEAVNGMESTLIASNALLDLTDLLPEYAPKLWELVPEETWDVVRAYDPSGQGRIYFVPSVIDFQRYGPLIRQDWLDTLGLAMPTTQEEFENVLRAFKEQDPNGNGRADEIPTGGRSGATWMDHLFAMYGIAMKEGIPQWDLYDGELTYSAVTQNMRDALEWIAKLYKEGLIDQESMLNDKSAWDGKMYANQVGIYYHWAESIASFTGKVFENSESKVIADWNVMPVISAPGYEGFYTTTKMQGALWCVANTKDEDVIASVMHVLDCYGDMELWEDFRWGIEGYEWEYDAEGQRSSLGRAAAETEHNVLKPHQKIITLDYVLQAAENNIPIYSKQIPELAEQYEAIPGEIRKLQESAKRIEGDGLPGTIYADYPDIKDRVLYIEYASKIITGEWPIEKFDEFVDAWYATGGNEVTQKAREWYQNGR